MVVSAARAIEGPRGAAVVARLESPEGDLEVLAAVGPESVRCAGCSIDLTAEAGAFTVQRFGPAGVPFPVCTDCEPLPHGAAIVSQRPLRALCGHPGCRQPHLVGNLALSHGDGRPRADLRWEHEGAAWGPAGAAHRPRPTVPADQR